jgi:FMN-dependent oxidoreductase (nitrilotriacetate monooxygenase family)
MKRQMHLGLFLQGTGVHPAGWRMPGAYDSFQDIGVVQSIARIAERGKFDMIFMSDHLHADPRAHPSFIVRFEPMTMLAALAMTTTHIGLGATVSTTYSDPFSVARVFASLDHISKGRAAWNLVTTMHAGAATNFGTSHPDHSRRYDRAGEFIDVVQGLWDCWDDDAIVANRTTGVYVDPDKIRSLDHEGEYFKVKGPLHIGRAPQGRPIVLQAGGSDQGLTLGARTADVMFSVVQDFEEAKTAYRSLKDKTHQFGRVPGEVKLLPGVMPIVGRNDREAFDLLQSLQGQTDAGVAMAVLSERLGQDMSGYDLDGPIPELPLADTSHAFSRVLLSKARRDKMTLRDLYNLNAAARGHWVLCGGPATIADTLQEWFEGGAADGFIVMPPFFPQGFEDFIDLVVPILQKRSLFRHDYAGDTLRDHLGLQRPTMQVQRIGQARDMVDQ